MTEQMGLLDSAAAALRTYLAESQDEIVVVWRLIDHGARNASCGIWIEWHELDEDFAAEARDIAACGGEVYAFRMRDLELRDDKGYVNLLLNAKVPNERGEVPIGGAY
jgi:hypothetical protein